MLLHVGGVKMTDNILYLLKRANEGFETIGNNALRKENLTFSQGFILEYLAKQNGQHATLKQIEKAFGLTQASLQGTVARLEKKKLVHLSTEITDRRVKNVVLTNQGQEVLEEIEGVMTDLEAGLFSILTKRESENFIKSLEKIYNKLYTDL